MKRKLELKDIVGYLPYGLKIENNIGKIVELTLSDAPYRFRLGFKPILRPLSDLGKKENKVIEELLKKFIELKSDKVFLWTDILEMMTTSRFELLPKFVIDIFYKHHIDVNGLIEKDLAININDLD